MCPQYPAPVQWNTYCSVIAYNVWEKVAHSKDFGTPLKDLFKKSTRLPDMKRTTTMEADKVDQQSERSA